MKAWVEDNVVRYAPSVTLEEAAELEEMLRQAFNEGLVSGFRQGWERAEIQRDAD